MDTELNDVQFAEMKEGLFLGPIMQLLEDKQDPDWTINPDDPDNYKRYPIDFMYEDMTLHRGYIQNAYTSPFQDGNELTCAILTEDEKNILTMSAWVHNPGNIPIDWDRLHFKYMIH